MSTPLNSKDTRQLKSNATRQLRSGATRQLRSNATRQLRSNDTRHRPLSTWACFLAALLALPGAILAAGPHFVSRYFYDQDKSQIMLVDLKFPTRTHGIAAGVIREGKRIEPTVLTTTDGGEHWSLVPVKEAPNSLFFLNETDGFLVGEKALWATADFGRTWRRAGDLPKGILKCWFLTIDHGWAIGANKQVLETFNGGKNWKSLAVALEPPGAVATTTYGAIFFLRNHGIIAGWNKPKDTALHAEWEAPDRRSYETPGTTIFLETTDGGKVWTSSSASMFGQLTSVSMALDASSLSLFEFSSRFDYPSEVQRTSARTGKTDRVYRDNHIRITDVALTLKGKPYLAGHEMVGIVRDNPIPGKLKVFTSEDFAHWNEIPVDYRAAAHRSFIALAEDSDVWVATDTGMILKLQND